MPVLPEADWVYVRKRHFNGPPDLFAGGALLAQLGGHVMLGSVEAVAGASSWAWFYCDRLHGHGALGGGLSR